MLILNYVDPKHDGALTYLITMLLNKYQFLNRLKVF